MRGRRSELEFTGGALVARARELGIAVPAQEALYALVRSVLSAAAADPALHKALAEAAAEALSKLEFGAAETLTNPDRAELMARFKSA